MKSCIYIIGIVIICMMQSCVSESSYDELQKTFEQNKKQNLALIKELDELKFGKKASLEKGISLLKENKFILARTTLKEIISKYPNTVEWDSANSILAKIDEIEMNHQEESDWNQANANNADFLFQRYVATYPNGKHASEANIRYKKLRVKKEEDLWKDAKSSMSASKIQSYLDDFPSGKHHSAAMALKTKAEVNDIFKGDHGLLPPMSRRSSGRGSSGDVSLVNGTDYELTIRYDGPETKRIVVKAGASSRYSLRNGSYRVAASVNTSNVRNYAGVESVNGGIYESRYYISHDFH